jgi:tRNA nucleotidyltransferase (CCA-adding enzyme)
MKTSLPAPIKKIVKAFKSNSFEIYLVGGAVRDMIMKRTVSDWDLTTNATPSQIQHIFPKNSFYNNKFGTVGIVFENDVYEVTTFRKESDYKDKRHPEKISWGKTINDDLSRRDFTINAIAVDLFFKNNQLTRKIIDPYKGREAIKNKLIIAVGNPDERFSEDALRMMRAIRIGSQLGFLIEENTFASIIKNSKLIKNISWERIREEFFKILISPNPDQGIVFLLNAKLLKHIIPELIVGRGIDQAKHHTDDVWTHSLKSLKFAPSKDPIVKLATLIHDIGKPETAKGDGEERTFFNHEIAGAKIANTIGHRLKLSKNDLVRLRKLVRWHQFSVDEKQTDKALRRFIKNVGKNNLQDVLKVRTGDRLGSGVKKTSWRTELFKKRLVEVQKQPFSIKDLKINGQDVMKNLNIPPGPKVGEILKTIFAEVEENIELNDRKKLLKRVTEIDNKN